MNLICTQKCFDNTDLKVFYEGDPAEPDEKTLARWAKCGFLAYFVLTDGETNALEAYRKDHDLPADTPLPRTPETEEIIEQAQAAAEEILDHAREKAAAMLEEANQEVARILDRATAPTEPEEPLVESEDMPTEDTGDAADV